MQIDFPQYCFLNNTEFFKERLFLLNVAKKLEKFMLSPTDKICRLSMPARAGKSYVTSLLNTWILGEFSNVPIMRTTFAYTLFQKLSNDTRRIILSENWQKIYNPENKIKLNGTTDEWLLSKDMQPSHWGGGWQGGLNGKGAKILEADDMYKNYADATSPNTNIKLKSLTDSVFMQRKEKNFKILLIGTRWTKTDFFTFFEPDIDIIIPAIDENGKSFCEAIAPINELLTTKKTIPQAIWDAMYMQRPSAEGRIKLFSFEDFRTIVTLPKFKAYISVADPSFGVGGDQFVVIFAGITDANDVIIIDVEINSSLKPEGYLEIINNYNKINKSTINCIEGNGVGSMVYEKVQPLFNGFLYKFTSKGEKYARVYSSQDEIKEVAFWDNCKNNVNTRIQLDGFPTAEHDDVPDAFASLIQMKKFFGY